MITMVTPEDDNGVIGQAQPIQGIDHSTNLGIHEGNRGVVGEPALLRLCSGHTFIRPGFGRS